ncbi:hypothetical protein FA13DRAFT_1818637 [Coprinellus micaceus]|uniref:HTH myb-type domain-containing protein n=1 Tax=Coprinellus micaceus TaxID=71717 RepID=A0A4Y7SMJ1_COPMI|nr:hypothetical protein FA13DRAFT_1818637 [Coprinellus micaceus]
MSSVAPSEASTSAQAGGAAQQPFAFKTPALPVKQRRVSLALPSSPRVVEGWSFRDDTGLGVTAGESSASGSASPLATDKKKGRSKSELSAATTPEEEGDEKEEKKPGEEAQEEHGVGNWKTILRDPTLKTYYPDAYRLHYPNAKTHLSSKVRSTLPDGRPLFEKTRSKRRRPFTEEEDKALKEGYEKYGTVWATIVKDYPIFQEQNRRSTDLEGQV